MSQSQQTTTRTGFAISPREQGIVYFVGLILIYVAAWRPSIGTPMEVVTIFTGLGTVAVIVKYELSQMAPQRIPQSRQALYGGVAYTLSIVGGLISNVYPNTWYGGLVLAVIGAILAAYTDIGGTIPHIAVPAPATPGT